MASRLMNLVTFLSGIGLSIGAPAQAGPFDGIAKDVQQNLEQTIRESAHPGRNRQTNPGGTDGTAPPQASPSAQPTLVAAADHARAANAGRGKSSGLLRPLNLKTLKGKPRWDSEDFSRYLELLALGSDPEMIAMTARNERDKERWCHEISGFAARQLSDAAIRTYFLGLRGRKGRRLLQTHQFGGYCGGYWKGNDEFSQRDSFQAFVSRAIPAIQAATAKLKFPKQAIMVRDMYLSYDFAKGAFNTGLSMFDTDPQGEYWWLNARPLKYQSLYLPGFKMPARLKMPADQARAIKDRLDDHGQAKAQIAFTLAGLSSVPAKDRHGRVKKHSDGRIEMRDAFLVRVDSIDIYDARDQGMTRVLHTLPASAYFNQAAYKEGAGATESAAREQQRLAELEQIALPGEHELAAAYARLSADTATAVDAILAKEAAQQRFDDPFKEKAFMDSERAAINRALAAASPGTEFWLTGIVAFDKYDAKTGTYPVSSIKLIDYSPTQGHMPLRYGHAVEPELESDQISTTRTPEAFARQHRSGGRFAFRAKARAVAALPARDSKGRGPLRLKLELREMDILGGPDHVAIQTATTLDPRKVAWTLRPLGIDELNARKAAGRARTVESQAQQTNRIQGFDKQLAACEQEPPAQRETCISRLCGNLPELDDEQAAYRLTVQCDERREAAHLAAVLAKSAAKRKARAQERDAIEEKQIRKMKCSQRYSRDKGAVPDSPEFEAAIARCMEEQVRTPYGPAVLGIQLGMERQQATALAEQQTGGSGSKKLRARQTEPFRWGQLNISQDLNHGVATFYVGNGGSHKVIAVSRRQYFADNAPTGQQFMAAIRDTYGTESWREGNVVLWSQSADPAGCAAARDLIHERGIWSSRWRDPDNPRNKSGRQLPVLDAEGSADDYARFADCGPLLFAFLNDNGQGAIGDLSLVLFDPAWMAEQPAFRFRPRAASGNSLRF